MKLFAKTIIAALLAAPGGPALAQSTAAPLPNPLGLAINHVALGVASIAVERAFYHDILGFEPGPSRQRPHYTIQQMQLPGFRIDLIEQPGSQRPAASMGTDKQGWLHLTFTVQEVAPIYHRLQAEGVKATPGRMDGEKIGSIFLTDPEGNRIEIANP